jgi:hypothetical protein
MTTGEDGNSRGWMKILSSLTLLKQKAFVVCLEPKRITTILTLIVLGLVLGDSALKFSRFYLEYESVSRVAWLFNLGGERNIPALYSSVILLFCSILLLAIADTHAKIDRHYFYWAGLAAVFLFLSLDEGVMVHESLSKPIEKMLQPLGVSFIGWIIAYGVATVIFALVYAKFLLTLPARTRFLFVVAGSIYVMGALGMEVIGAHYYKLAGLKLDGAVIICSIIEEALEMTGIVIFIYGLTSHRAVQLQDSHSSSSVPSTR